MELVLSPNVIKTGHPCHQMGHVINPQPEDIETLKRALQLATTGTYRTADDVAKKLIDENRARVEELLADEFMRIRINALCLKNWRPSHH